MILTIWNFWHPFLTLKFLCLKETHVRVRNTNVCNEAFSSHDTKAPSEKNCHWITQNTFCNQYCTPARRITDLVNLHWTAVQTIDSKQLNCKFSMRVIFVKLWSQGSKETWYLVLSVSRASLRRDQRILPPNGLQRERRVSWKKNKHYKLHFL